MRSLGTSALLLVVACVAAGSVSAKTPAKATTTASLNTCRVIASGEQGGAGSTGQTNVSSIGTAGGVALGDKAFGGLTLNCNNYGDVLTVTVPGHKFATGSLIRCGGPCTSNSCATTTATTLTCHLSKNLEAVGVKAVGSWQATLQWNYAITDEAATNTTDGTCHLSIVAAIALGGKPTFTGKDISACAYAKGDVVQ